MSASRTAPRRWLALALLCVAQFMVVLDVSIVNVALPSIQEDLGFSEANLQWVVSGYALTFGGFLMLAGRAADLFGRRRFFAIGLALFSLSSLLCGLAPSPTVLVAARALQGLGAALVSPAALSLLTTTFREGEQRNRALGVWGAVAAGGAAAGLLLGGVLTSALGWEWNFFVNVPVGALAVAFVPALLSESRDRTAPRLDLVGAATVTGGLGLLVYGLDVATDAGFASPRALGVLGLALALIVGFCVVEGRVRNPLVPFRIFRSRTLAGADLVTLVLSAVIGAQGFFCTLYMQQILGYSPLVTGLAFLPLTVTIMVAAGVGSTLASRGGAKVTMVSGMALLAIGMVLLARISSDGGYLGVLLPGFVFTALGLGFTFVSATIAGTSGVADGEQGLASGLINTAQQVGTALGLAILVTVAAARTGALAGGNAPSAGDLIEGYRMAFLFGGGLAALGACIALFVVRRDECEEAASKLEDHQDAAAFLAECRQASRM